MTGMTAEPTTTGAYAAAYEQSLRDPSAFWGEAARGVDWVHEPDQVLDTGDLMVDHDCRLPVGRFG